MSNLEQVNQGPESARAAQAQRSQLALSQLQHGAWLLEMERALLQANQLNTPPQVAKQAAKSAPVASFLPQAASEREKAPAQHEPVPGASVAPVASGAPGTLVPAPVAGHDGGFSQSASEPANVAAASKPGSAGFGHGDDRLAQPGSPATKLSEQAGVADQVGVGLPLPVDGSATGVSVLDVAALSGVNVDATLAAGNDLASALLRPYAGAYGLLANATQDAAQANLLAPTALPNVPARAGLPLFSGSLQPANKGREGQEPLVNQESSQADLTAAPETEPYARRQLHLYQQGDGIQAWLRDADLNPAQIQNVAQALSAELSNAGLKLKALSVNGRKLSDAQAEYDSIAPTDESNENTGPKQTNQLSGEIPWM